MQLITYFAGDGDLDTLMQIPKGSDTGSMNSAHSTPRKQTLVLSEEEQLLNVSDQQPQDISNLSKSQHQHVNELLGEAMKESLAVAADIVSNRNQVNYITCILNCVIIYHNLIGLLG